MAVLVPDEPGLALWKLNRDALPLHLGDHFVLRDGHVVALLLCYCVAFPPAIKLIDCPIASPSVLSNQLSPECY